MDFAHVGWREALVLVIAIIAVYLGYGLVRLLSIKSRHGKPSPAASAEPPVTPPPALETDTRAKTDFALQQFMAGVQGELDQLRDEITLLKDELAKLKLMRGAAPQYSEAMQLAQADLSPEMIANRCGISVGEAELVISLMRQGVKDGRDE